VETSVPDQRTASGKTYRCSIEVRGYELDSFSHVNHAVYVSYFEHARWKLLSEEEITLEKFNLWKRWPVIGQIEVQYLKPAFMGDTLEIATEILEQGKTNITFQQEIRRADIPIARAKVRSVIVNENGRPSEMPESLAALIHKRATE
jgi:acyl-CoA thioester hydrolase